jgi:hypothetical protein
MAGLTVGLNAATINQRLGTIAANVVSALEDVQKGQQFLQQNNDAELVADYQMVQTDIDQLRAAFADLDELRAIYRGQQALAAPKNFRSNVRRIIGLGFL